MTDGTAGGGRRRPGGRPDGVPLGRAFLIGPGLANEPLREAIDVVARVHGDGDLPTIPVVWDSTLDVRARFVIRDGLPSVISANPMADGITFGVIHEIGHYLDYCAIDGLGAFASAGSELMESWFAAVVQTPTVRSLSEVIDDALADLPPADVVRRDRVESLGLADELWARCYTQYVVRRGDRPDLVESLVAERVGTVAGIDFPLHWTDDEFGPLDEEIERLFRSLGWRRS
jgi:hypothetical protein